MRKISTIYLKTSIRKRVSLFIGSVPICITLRYLILVYMSGVPKMDITATREELNEKKEFFSQPAGFEPALPEGI